VEGIPTMRFQTLVLLACIWGSASVAQSHQNRSGHSFADRTGNDMLDECQYVEKPSADRSSVEADKALACLAYVRGLIDGYELGRIGETGRAMFCMPEEATLHQAALVVVKYLRDHPQDLHHSDAEVVLYALAAGFPCHS